MYSKTISHFSRRVRFTEEKILVFLRKCEKKYRGYVKKTRRGNRKTSIIIIKKKTLKYVYMTHLSNIHVLETKGIRMM